MKNYSKTCAESKRGCQWAEDCGMTEHSCHGECQYYKHRRDGRDIPKRTLVDYVEATDACDWLSEKDLMTDEQMVERLAFVYLNPSEIFQVWLKSLWFWIRH